MTVRFEAGVVFLEGECPVDEAETLLEILQANPGVPVDWTGCRHAHTALLQVLMAARAVTQGEPEDAFLRTWGERFLCS